MPQTFFDTPMFKYRLLGRATHRTIVENMVRDSDVATSSYVQQQFRDTFVRTIILVHTMLTNLGTVTEVLRNLNLQPISPGQANKAREALIVLMEDEVGSVEDKLERLARWIELEAEDILTDGIDVSDATKCELTFSLEQRDGMYQMRRECRQTPKRPCRIESYWQERSSLLAALADTPTEGKAERIHKAAKAVNNGASPRGQTCTVDLSDAVIAAESESDAVLMTSNLSDFQYLAKTLPGTRTVDDPIGEGGAQGLHAAPFNEA